MFISCKSCSSTLQHTVPCHVHGAHMQSLQLGDLDAGLASTGAVIWHAVRQRSNTHRLHSVVPSKCCIFPNPSKFCDKAPSCFQPSTCKDTLLHAQTVIHPVLNQISSFLSGSGSGQLFQALHTVIVLHVCRSFPEAFTQRCFAFEPSDEQVESSTSAQMVLFPPVTSGESF